MTEKEFQHNMAGAETLRNFTEMPEISNFWAGYLRGVRCNYYGAKFGTDKEHARWMALAESDDDSRRARGLGYRKGFAGESVRDAVTKAETLSVNEGRR
jgi:hypothetical protein